VTSDAIAFCLRIARRGKDPILNVCAKGMHRNFHTVAPTRNRPLPCGLIAPRPLEKPVNRVLTRIVIRFLTLTAMAKKPGIEKNRRLTFTTETKSVYPEFPSTHLN